MTRMRHPLIICKKADNPFSVDSELLSDTPQAIDLLSKMRLQMLNADESEHSVNIVIQAYSLDSKETYELDEIELASLATAAGFNDVAVWLGLELEADQVKKLLSNFVKE